MINILALAAAMVVFWRLLHVISILDYTAYQSARWCFLGQAATQALVGAGTVAILVHWWQAGGILLLVGLALHILCDRRRT